MVGHAHSIKGSEVDCMCISSPAVHASTGSARTDYCETSQITPFALSLSKGERDKANHDRQQSYSLNRMHMHGRALGNTV